MATPNPPNTIRLSGLARRLVQNKHINEEEALKAQEQAQRKKIPLVSYLVENNILPANTIARSASIEFGMPVFDLNAFDLTLVPDFDLKIIRRLGILPLIQRANRVFIATSDPTNLQALDDLKFHYQATIDPVLVEDDKLKKILDKIIEDRERSAIVMADGDDADLANLEFLKEEEEEEEISSADIEDVSIVKTVNKFLLDAINQKASDLHFEPYEHYFRVRYRVDGVLQEIANPPIKLASKIIARLKVMSSMDIAEKRVPQDGRIKLKIGRRRAIDFRANSCPTLFGEKVVLRILDSSSAKLGIDILGYEPEQKQRYLNALDRPQGMILVTGPTGSGKTVSLYTGINILNTTDRNISTAEDPAEINLPGINQVNVDNKKGLTFAAALKSFLRQDPDVIMVGEVRDLETGEIAIKAAQTGHLVLSTLHTNDAPQTLTRLLNMGIPAYNIASSVILIIAQRLGRRLCSNCKIPDDAPPEALIEEGFSEDEVYDLKIFKNNPDGCDNCNKGYKGRVGIYQVMPISDEMGRIIMAGGNAIELADQAAREGIATIRQSGLKKVKDGITSLAEINRVTTD